MKKKREARNNQFTCQQSSLPACLINCILIKFKLISAKLDITLIPINDDNLAINVTSILLRNVERKVYYEMKDFDTFFYKNIE